MNHFYSYLAVILSPFLKVAAELCGLNIALLKLSVPCLLETKKAITLQRQNKLLDFSLKINYTGRGIAIGEGLFNT
jgi:hypothetical protein